MTWFAASTPVIATRREWRADSDTETFVALRAFVDNWRWEGVPFYLRSGKRMAEDHHVLTVAFAQPPRRMFPLDCTRLPRRSATIT